MFEVTRTLMKNNHFCNRLLLRNCINSWITFYISVKHDWNKWDNEFLNDFNIY